jgi:hypothetical protein
MFLDLLSLLSGSTLIFVAKAAGTFQFTIVLGIILAAICWYVCTVYTQLWNKRFHVTLVHHVICGFASVCTLLFVILFQSLSYTKDAALTSIHLWQAQLNADQMWADQTFAKAYAAVKELGTEDFSKAPAPGNSGTFIPTKTDQARQTAAAMYADEACRHFDMKRPFLSKIVWSSPGVPSDTIFEDVRAWHAHNPSYPPSRAIDIAASQIQNGLEPQAPRVVYVARLFIVFLFLLVQAVPFGLIGWAAYRDIKVH